MNGTRWLVGLTIVACVVGAATTLVRGQQSTTTGPAPSIENKPSSAATPDGLAVWPSQQMPPNLPAIQQTARPLLPSPELVGPAPTNLMPPPATGKPPATSVASPERVTLLPVSPGAPAGQEIIQTSATLPPPSTIVSPMDGNGPIGRLEAAVNVEWIGPPTARLGQPATYQLVVRNVSPGPVHQVVVKHRLPDGVNLTTSEPRAQSSGDGTLSWELGTLAPSQESRIDLRLLPVLRSEIQLNAFVTFTGSAGIHVQVHEPKLALKVTAPERVVLGDPAALTLTVSNPGDGPAERVRVKALLPEGLDHARGRQIEVEIGNLAPKEMRCIQLICASRVQGVLRCEAHASADTGLSAHDAAQVEVLLPRLDLAVSGPRLRYIDRHAVYTFKVTNPSAAPANNVTITDLLPGGLKFHTASGGGRYDFSSRTVAWFIGDLLAGQSREVTLEVAAAELGDQKHTATASAVRGLKTEVETVTHVEGLSSLGLEMTDADDPVEVGADTSYEIRVVNNGSRMETNLELSCTLPEKMEFRGARCGAGSRFRNEGREVIFEPVARLAPRADLIYHIDVRGTASGDVRLQARVKADGLSQPIVRDEATKVYGDDR